MATKRAPRAHADTKQTIDRLVALEELLLLPPTGIRYKSAAKMLKGRGISANERTLQRDVKFLIAQGQLILTRHVWLKDHPKLSGWYHYYHHDTVPLFTANLNLFRAERLVRRKRKQERAAKRRKRK